MGLASTGTPWYVDRLRWGQTNLVEIDPVRFDLDFWRRQWRRTHVQGLVVNCGGIVAYYPSTVEHHPWAPGIEHRDLFGEIVTAARAEGLAVLARMDSSRAGPSVFAAHPEWFAVDADGVPLRRGDQYLTCTSGGYYRDLIPAVLTEAAQRYAPDGFADNAWTGVDRSRICHCEACRRAFHVWSGGEELPSRTDWSSAVFRSWVAWGYARRTELWDANNAVTRAAGGVHCRWVGMVHGRLTQNANAFQDVAALAKRTPILLLDHQSRRAAGGTRFTSSAEAAKRLRGVLGAERPVVVSTAMYDLGRPVSRLSSMPAAEVQLWATHGWAGGAQPWWHHVGGRHEDRRQYETPVELFGWHRQHADLLTDREPVADVGVVWSQQNLDLHGRDQPEQRVLAPYLGMVDVLTAHQLTYVPVHVDQIADTPARVLVLPEVAVLTDQQCHDVRAFVARGGSLLATGDTSLRDGDGHQRPELGLADLLGARVGGGRLGGVDDAPAAIDRWERHSYLRLADGPGRDHPVLSGLGDTDTIPFGGALRVVAADPDREVLLTWIPPFPTFPPETAWMSIPRTGVPAMIIGRPRGGGRVAYLPADLDRCVHRDEQPDHATILAGALRWLIGSPVIEVEGPWPVSVSLYRRGRGLVLHLNSLLTTSSVPGRQDRAPAYGPLTVRIRTGSHRLPVVRAHVRLGRLPATVGTEQLGDVIEHWTEVTVESLAVHEVLTITGLPESEETTDD